MRLKLPRGEYGKLFFEKDEMSKSRLAMLIHTVLTAVITQLTTGIFFTGFLIGYDIDIVGIGVVTFIPYIATLASAFAPYFLGRFKKRRGILLSLKLSYFILTVLAVTLVPLAVNGTWARIFMLCAALLLGNICNAVSEPGLTAWHLNFLPFDTRSRYFNASLFLSSLIPGIMILVTSRIADSVSDPAAQLRIIVILRFCACLVVVFEMLSLLRPKEVPQESSHERVRPTDVFTVPVRDRRFMTCMVIVFFWQFSSQGYIASWNVYLLESVGMSYTYFNIIIATYSVFFIIFGRFWLQRMNRFSWFTVFSYSVLVLVPTQFLYSFANADNYFVLVFIIRMIQHFLGVGHNVAFSNIAFSHVPSVDSTAYISFYTIVSNLGLFAGTMLSTLFIRVCGDFSLTFFGKPYTPPQMLVFFSAVIMLVLALYVRRKSDYLAPEKSE